MELLLCGTSSLPQGRQHIGDLKIADSWAAMPSADVVINCFDKEENRTRFIKPWKPGYAAWPVMRAVPGTLSVQTFFLAVEGRHVNDDIGSYAKPCYRIAYELKFCLGWDPHDMTPINLGTGEGKHELDPRRASGMRPWQWLGPVMDAVSKSSDDEQVHLVGALFPSLGFRSPVLPEQNWNLTRFDKACIVILQT